MVASPGIAHPPSRSVATLQGLYEVSTGQLTLRCSERRMHDDAQDGVMSHGGQGTIMWYSRHLRNLMGATEHPLTLRDPMSVILL